jgi:hypothetical protein
VGAGFTDNSSTSKQYEGLIKVRGKASFVLGRLEDKDKGFKNVLAPKSGSHRFNENRKKSFGFYIKFKKQFK